MKKKYLQPQISVYEIAQQTLLAASSFGETEQENIGTGEGPMDAGSAL